MPQSNDTTVTDGSNRLLIFLLGFWFPSIVSVLLNTFIIVLSLRKNLIKGDFKYFICHLSVADLTASACVVFLQFVIVVGHPNYYWTWVCDLAGTIYWTGMQTMILAVALLAFNRYVSMCKSQNTYKAIFTKKKMALMFGVTQAFCSTIGQLHWVDVFYYGRHPVPDGAVLCNGIYKEGSALVFAGTNVSGMLSLAALGATIYFVTCTKRKIQQHSEEVREIMDEQKFIQNKNLVKALTAQLCIALLAIIPPIVVAMFPSVAADVLSQGDAQMFMACNPALDAIATLTVTAPYRRVTANWFKQLRKGHALLKDPANENKKTVPKGVAPKK